MYFRDELLPINSQTHLRHFLRKLGDPQADDQSLGTVGLNRLLLEGMRSCGDFSGWPTKEMERLLYSSEIDPFDSHAADRPDSNAGEFISELLAEWGVERLEARRESEDQARNFLDETAGEMSEPQARALLELFNSDVSKGKPRRRPLLASVRRPDCQRAARRSIELQRVDPPAMEGERRGDRRVHG